MSIFGHFFCRSDLFQLILSCGRKDFFSITQRTKIISKKNKLGRKKLLSKSFGKQNQLVTIWCAKRRHYLYVVTPHASIWKRLLYLQYEVWGTFANFAEKNCIAEVTICLFEKIWTGIKKSLRTRQGRRCLSVLLESFGKSYHQKLWETFVS